MELTITMTSQDQVNCMYALFNIITTCTVLTKYGIDSDLIRESLRETDGVSVDYSEPHDELRRLLK